MARAIISRYTRQKGEKNLMNDREKRYNERKMRGRQVQQELENQLRAFGDTLSDALPMALRARGGILATAPMVWAVRR